MISASQIRAGRALLDWSQQHLAEVLGVSTMTIKRAEGRGKPPVPEGTLDAIRKALEDAGVLFIAENGGGAGVRLKNRS